LNVPKQFFLFLQLLADSTGSSTFHIAPLVYFSLLVADSYGHMWTANAAIHTCRPFRL
jgi:hypothetical protein